MEGWEMILLSAHRDTIKPNYKLTYENGSYFGLLDNFIGRLVLDSLIISDINISWLEKEGRIKIFYGEGEEWGLTYDFPKISNEDIVICVDVASGKRYNGYDFAIENMSGFSEDEMNRIQDIKWEGYNALVREYDGNPEDEDEAWKWKELGHKVLSFIIPIENGSEETGWHVDDCTISIEKIRKCKDGLSRLINYMV
jgi:hypothetical protein